MSGPIKIAITPMGIPAPMDSPVTPSSISDNEYREPSGFDCPEPRFLPLDKDEYTATIKHRNHVATPMTLDRRLGMGILREKRAGFVPFPVPRGEYVPKWSFTDFSDAMQEVKKISSRFPGSDLTTNQKLLFMACVGEFLQEHLTVPPIRNVQIVRHRRSPDLNLKMTRLKRVYQLYHERPTPENAVIVEDVLSDMALLKKDAKSLSADLNKGLAPILDRLTGIEILLVIESLALLYDAE